MDTFLGLGQDLTDSPEIKELMLGKTQSVNPKNAYERMRDMFFESKRPGTLKLNKQKTSTYD